MNKIAIFSDIHFGIHQNDKEWIFNTFFWLKHFKDECLKRKVKNVIFCGDFFNPRDTVNWDTVNYGKICIEFLRKYFKLFLIVGNHCCFYKNNTEINSLNIFKGLKNVCIIDNVTTINIENRKITLVPWIFNLNDIPKSDIIFGHFEIDTFKMSGKICKSDLTAQKLLSKAPLIFSGHFHTNDERKYNNGEIIYVGNPFEMDFNDENNRKGFYILNLDDLKYEFIQNTISPKHHKIFLSKWIHIDNDKKENIVKNNIIKFIKDIEMDDKQFDAIISNIKFYKPFSFNIEYYCIKNIKDDDIRLNILNIENAFKDFINSLDCTNKNKLFDYIIEKYNKTQE